MAAIPSEMYQFYVSWLANYNTRNGTSLKGFTLLGSGGNFSYSCQSCHPGMGGGYPDIPMANGEMCISCHGGVANYDPGSVGPFSTKPRILYNPSHLGIVGSSGKEYPPPVGAPNEGSNVSGFLPIPIAIMRSFHTNYQNHLTYRIEVDFYKNGGLPDYQEDFAIINPALLPMRWNTGDPPRWLNEFELHKINAEMWPNGDHLLSFVPYDPTDGILGSAYAISVRKTPSIVVRDPLPVGFGCGGVSSDQKLYDLHDDYGKRIVLYCADMQPYDDEFHLYFIPAGLASDRVGRCPWGGGINFGYMIHTGDQDNNGTFDSFIGTFWRSEEPGQEQSQPGLQDWKTYEYDSRIPQIILKHFASADGPGKSKPDYLINRAVDRDPVYFNPDPQPGYGPMILKKYVFGDNDLDGDVDGDDYLYATLAVGQCENGNSYNEPADTDHDGCVTAQDLQETYPVIPVNLDIKPGSEPNSVNLGSAGVIPIAILSTAVFDATSVDPASILLASAPIKLVGRNNRMLYHFEDANGDGLLDLVCQIDTDQLQLEIGAASAELTAQTYDGQRISGKDAIQIVPKN